MTISNNHVLHSKIVLISAYSARNRSDLLLFSQKATPKKLANGALRRYVLPKTVSITISTHVSSWDTMMKSNSRKMSITMNKYSESMKSSNQRENFSKKMSWVKVHMKLNTVKTKKPLEMQRICHASTRKCVHVHGNYMIQTPSESSLVSFRAFFLGSKLTSAFHSWLGAKHRSYWASSEVSGDEASRSVTWSKIGCAGLAIEKSRMLLMVRLVKR